MRALFNAITATSLRFRWVTIAITITLIVLGFLSFQSLNQELLPEIEFPQTFVDIRNGGATSDQVLAAYTLPIEERAEEVSGVVNVESISAEGFGFITVRNEFGLDQDRIVSDLQAELDEIIDNQLPLRQLTPPDGMDGEDLIAELSPEALLWLYEWSLAENNGFLPQLDRDVWDAFTDEQIGALPTAAFDDLDSDLRDDLLDRAAAVDLDFTYDPEAPIALPETWQSDPRFATVLDITELATSRRNLAGVFNNLSGDDFLIGPLANTDDLTVADIELYLAIEEQCRAFRAENQTDLLEDGSDPCSFIADLDAATILALSAEIEAALPAGYLEQLSLIERNEVAQARVAEGLSGQVAEITVQELPDSWRMEAPQIVTFSFSDFPLAQVSVNSGVLTAEELEVFVDNEMVPALRDTDLVARVTTDGGERIPNEFLIPAFEAEGLSTEGLDTATAEEPDDASEETTEDEATEEDAQAEETGDTEEVVALPEGPDLPGAWIFLESAGLDESDTADDLIKGVGQTLNFNDTEVPISSPADFFNFLAFDPENTEFLLTTLEPDVFEYLDEQSPGFYRALTPQFVDFLAEVSPELAETLPPFVTSPSMGDTWVELSNVPTMAEIPLYTAYDVDQAGGAEIIGAIFDNISGTILDTYDVRLMDNVRPEALAALVELDANFLTDLEANTPDALRYLNREALESDTIAAFLEEAEDEALVADLNAIIEGAPTAAEERLQTESADRFVDDEAPDLPESWFGVASFVGATELDTADDIFNVPGYSGAADLINDFAVGQQGARDLVRDLEITQYEYLAEIEPSFWDDLSASMLLLIAPNEELVAQLPEGVQNRIAAGGEPYEPETTVTRTNTNPSLLVSVFKEDAANTVEGWDNVSAVLNDLENENEITVDVVFEQATFITTSLEGVQREGTLGATMAIVMILIFMNLSFRSTAVTSVSIPGSVFIAFVLIQIIPGNVYDFLAPIVDDVGRDTALGSVLTVVLRLFPENFTLNIMTLSGLTVAIGRVVDDSIVVLENIYRNISLGGDKREAVLQGTREVSVAIFAATLTTMVVFLPLGLFGGVTGSFFLPFGLAITYALVGSYVMAITIVPVLADLLITKESIPEEGTRDVTEDMNAVEKGWTRFSNIFIGGVEWLGEKYALIISWALRGWNRALVVGIAFVLLIFGLFLMGNRPQQFLPSFGEPTITVSADLPSQFEDSPVTIAETNAKVVRFEQWLETQDGVTTVQVTVGSSGGFAGFGGPAGSIAETTAVVSIGVEDTDTQDRLLPVVREQAELIFNDLNNNGEPDYAEGGETPDVIPTNVTVSGADAAGGGFGGFALVVQGEEGEEQPALGDLLAYNDEILQTLNEVDGLVNVELETAAGGTSYIRIDGVPALRYVGELESEDTIGTTQIALQDVQETIDEVAENNPALATNVEVTQGFESEQQSEGIIEIFISMGLATIIAYLLLTITFGNFILPLEILVSLPLAVVGAAIALTVTDRVLGLPALVGLLLLVGIVLTNAIVFLDRVQQNKREQNMNTYDALVEAGRTRLRPILMTATTTTIAQLPLAASTESGAIIAAELGTVVVGGLISSTILTLLLLPVIYSLTDNFIGMIGGAIGLGGSKQSTEAKSAAD